MKMMIVGDVHFGVRNNSQKYLDFQENWFYEELIPKLKANKECTDVLFLGDVFDSRVSLSPLVIRKVREVFSFLTRTYNVHCILGNHDIYAANNKNIHSLDILEDQGVTVYENPTTVELDNKKILMLPWIVEDEKVDVVKTLATQTFDYVFGHLEINGFEKSKGVAEEHGFNASIFGNCGKVYSGHFHLKGSNQNIIYTGTPYELTWSDYKDEKGIYLLDIGKDLHEFIPTTNTPRHLKLNSSDAPLDRITSKIVANNIVRYVFNDDITEAEKIKIIEKINSLEPFQFTVDDTKDYSVDNEEEIESSVKDTMSFLKEFLDVIEIPEGLEKNKVFDILEDLHNQSY